MMTFENTRSMEHQYPLAWHHLNPTTAPLSFPASSNIHLMRHTNFAVTTSQTANQSSMINLMGNSTLSLTVTKCSDADIGNLRMSKTAVICDDSTQKMI